MAVSHEYPYPSSRNHSWLALKTYTVLKEEVAGSQPIRAGNGRHSKTRRKGLVIMVYYANNTLLYNKLLRINIELKKEDASNRDIGKYRTRVTNIFTCILAVINISRRVPGGMHYTHWVINVSFQLNKEKC